MRPFQNHTVFKNNLLANFDISVQAGQGYPGWSPDTFTKLNQNVVVNLVQNPIRTSLLAKKYADAAKYTNDVNALLTLYEVNGDKAGWDVPTFGGNNISFTLVNKTNSGWASYQDTGGYNNAQLRPGEQYRFSVWVRTSDSSGLKVAAMSGTPVGKTNTPDSVVQTPDQTINASQGWQLLAWEFHNSTKSVAADMSFVLSQLSSDNSTHSLYGPILRGLTTYPESAYAQELINKEFFYLSRFGGQERLGFDGKQLYICASCQTVNGILGLNERWSLYSGRTKNTYILSSYANVDSGCQNLAIQNGKLVMSTQDDVTASWYFLTDSSGRVFLLNQDSDMLIGPTATNGPQLIKPPQLARDMAELGWSIGLDQTLKSAPLIPPQKFIEEAFAVNSNNSHQAFLFRQGMFCIFDTTSKSLLMMPTPLKTHSLFQNLPNGFENLTAAVNRSGQEAFLFLGIKLDPCGISLKAFLEPV